MKEIVIISGKGGTGKTSITASFAALAQKTVLADCDVDAADLHLILAPNILSETNFYSGHEATIRPDDCINCGRCQEHCRFDAIGPADTHAAYRIDPTACEGCGLCVRVCPAQAVDFSPRLCGKWFSSETRFGPMVHARLGIAAENSGKLVSLVRKEARKLAEKHDADWLLIDGPPGIGCPVIASLTGADGTVIITEPTCSGEHDLERVMQLASHFGIPVYLCVNKWDINPEMTEQIETLATRRGATILGRIPYDRAVTAAQIAGQCVIEHTGPAADNIKTIWETLCQLKP